MERPVELSEADIRFVKHLVETRVAVGIRMAVAQIWARRGGLHWLEPDDAREFAYLVGRLERLAARLESHAE